MPQMIRFDSVQTNSNNTQCLLTDLWLCSVELWSP